MTEQQSGSVSDGQAVLNDQAGSKNVVGGIPLERSEDNLYHIDANEKVVLISDQFKKDTQGVFAQFHKGHLLTKIKIDSEVLYYDDDHGARTYIFWGEDVGNCRTRWVLKMNNDDKEEFERTNLDKTIKLKEIKEKKLPKGKCIEVVYYEGKPCWRILYSRLRL